MGLETTPSAARPALTVRLVEQALALRFEQLPGDVRRVARDCLVDWLGCTLAGGAEPVSRIVAAAAQEEGGPARATFIGRAARGTVAQAALVNGTTSHALDYDDVHLAVPGHLSAAMLPALLALAEDRGAGADALATAFVAGFETACRIGCLVEPAHYANGFHTTATIGSLGAAVGCAHLLQLPPTAACHALALAATQAAGLKAMFGTMAKPLHAGLAAQAGLRAAVLAGKGLTARTDVLECVQGYADVHGRDFRLDDALAAPPAGFHILGVLFKFHAACYSTHAAIDAVVALREAHALAPEAVAAIEVVAGEGCSICNIAEPATALEAKFSLRAAAAFALLGIDTSALASWARAMDPEVVAVRDRVSVSLVPGMGLSDAVVTLRLRDGTCLQRHHDCGLPPADKAAQSARVAAKFLALATPALGAARARQALEGLADSDGAIDLRALLALCQGAGP